jgi:hypothetical protein
VLRQPTDLTFEMIDRDIDLPTARAAEPVIQKDHHVFLPPRPCEAGEQDGRFRRLTRERERVHRS